MTDQRKMADPRDHHMWMPAFQAGEQFGRPVLPAQFADWYVTQRWTASVTDALSEYLTIIREG